MSNTKTFRRKIVRRRGTSHGGHQNTKQSQQPFFDFNTQQSFFSAKASDSAVNRKCDQCEKEDKKLQRTENASSAQSAPAKASSYINSLPGKGSPLPAQTRTFFEPKFGSDFSHVKIHNDQESGEVASSLHARAFTHKNHIVFNAGQYNPGSSAGKHLLAHELTHVLQQDNSIARKEVEQKEEEKVQRAEQADFAIRGLAPELKKVPNIIRFEGGSAMVPDEDKWKIKEQAKQPARVLDLNGFTSEEGSAQQNTTLANGRISTVSDALRSEGHTARHNPKADIKTGEGQSNYRSMRIVEILGIGDTSIAPSCNPPTMPCGTSLTDAFPIAVRKVVKSIAALAMSDEHTRLQVSNFFGAAPPSEILRNLEKLPGKMGSLLNAHNVATDCHKKACDASCEKGAGAYIDDKVSPEKMIFCETFVNNDDAEKRADTFIHETLHVTPDVFTKDIAYAHTRRFPMLPDAEKLKNTDSYVQLIRVLDDPKAVPPRTPVDTISGTANAAEKDFAQKSIYFLEQWLIAAKFISAGLYDEIHEGLTDPSKWEKGSAYSFTMHDLSALFSLTDPGTSRPFTLPTQEDKIKVAGISDRYLSMNKAVVRTNLTLSKSTTGSEGWAANLGNKVDVLPSYFTKTQAEAIRHLILLMLKSMKDVPASLVSAYQEGADKMRTQRKVGP